MKIQDAEKIIFGGDKLRITASKRQRIENSYQFLKEFSKDKVIYGINTGFGPMAQYRVSDEDLLAFRYRFEDR